MQEEEVWKDVVGFEQYFKISQFGEVWSKRTGKTLKQTMLKSGYWVINTRIGGRNGIAYSIRVHRMVAEAFLSPPSQELIDICSMQHFGKVIVRHKDNIKTNNSYDNLIWGTCQDNTNDWLTSPEYAVNNVGIESRSGCNNVRSRLTEDDVEYIRTFYKPKCRVNGCRALAKRFGVHHAVISSIFLRKTYKNVQ